MIGAFPHLVPADLDGLDAGAVEGVEAGDDTGEDGAGMDRP
jgi:hypothetical protein